MTAESSIPEALAGYERFAFTHGPWTRTVYRKGTGPAVIVMHEMPNLHPMVVRFATRVAAAGMTVYLPSLFGRDGKVPSKALRACGKRWLKLKKWLLRKPRKHFGGLVSALSTA